jgi:hypothetical protein
MTRHITGTSCIGLLVLLAVAWADPVKAQARDSTGSDAAALAKKLANPIGALISVPFQNNMDVGIGEYNGSRNTLNFQPIVPFELTAKFNLITRMILPMIAQYDITGEGAQQSGLADALVSGWVSNAVVKNGWVWGLGAAFLVPTATDAHLGAEKFGLGPTAIVLKQAHGWTAGILVNQVWSVAGVADTADVNQMYMQPFVTHNWKSGSGITLNAEVTQNWEASSTVGFINLMFGGLTRLGKQTVQLQVGPRFQIAAPDGGKSAFGVRTALILVFPKK